MKRTNDLFSRLPSVNDLLENPQIKGLVDRVEKLEVTTGVRQFVEKMRREVSRRSLDMPIPSIGDLADRAARYILGRQSSERPPAINATGQLWPPGLSGPPLAYEALAVLTEAAQHYHVASPSAGDSLVAGETVARLAGGEAAAVFNTPIAATLLAMASLSGSERKIAVARGELGTLDGARLTDLAHQAGATLVEVGATDTVQLSDYEQALQSGALMVLRIESLPHALRNATTRPTLEELSKLASAHSAVLVHNIGRGGLSQLPESIPLDVITASQSLASGAALVIARGDGYTGGPACGIAVGQKASLQKLMDSAWSTAFLASGLVTSALDATLALYHSPEKAVLAIPSLAILSTPILNLQSRAERIAAQIAVQPGIVSASPHEIAAGADLGGARPLPSFGVSVICQSDMRQAVADRLDAARPQVAGTWNGDQLLLDLRTVLPDEDIALVAAFDVPATDSPTGSETATQTDD